MVGAGFETKMGTGLLVLPALAAAYFWVAPRGRMVAVRQLLAGGAATAVVGLAWPLLVWWPRAPARPGFPGTADTAIGPLTRTCPGSTPRSSCRWCPRSRGGR